MTAEEVTLAKDEHPIQAFSASTLHPSLGECVRRGRPRGSLHHFDGFRPEDLVEGGDELAVAVTDEDLRRQLAVSDPLGQVARLLSHPVSVRVARTPGQEYAAGGQIDEEEHVEPAEEHRVDGEEVAGQDSACVGSDELPPVETSSPRRGW